MDKLELKRGKFRVRMSESRATRGAHIIEKMTGGLVPSRFGSMTAEDLHDLREVISEYLLRLNHHKEPKR